MAIFVTQVFAIHFILYGKTSYKTNWDNLQTRPGPACRAFRSSNQDRGVGGSCHVSAGVWVTVCARCAGGLSLYLCVSYISCRVRRPSCALGLLNLNRVQKVDTWQQQVAHERRTRADARADEELYRKRIATDEWLQSLRRWDPQTARYVSRRKTVAVVLE